MSQNSESMKPETTPVGGVLAAQDPVPVAATTSCRKKKADVNEGFFKDIVNHIDEFVHASYDEHKSCLQKTVHKLFGMNRAVESSKPTAAPPVVNPLRSQASTD